MANEWDEFRSVSQGREPADEWAEFAEAKAPPRRKRSQRREPAPEQDLRPTGQVHDGDTYRMRGGGNARLYGADAFELDQTGKGPNGDLIRLGEEARSAFRSFAQPSATISAKGAQTYGRPVVSVEAGGQDAASELLRMGLAVTTPRYLQQDQSRLFGYAQTEREARMNHRGAFAGEFQTPENYRRGEGQPETAGKEAVFWDDPTPYQGLPKEQNDALMAIWTDFNKGAADYIAYAERNGIQINPKIAAEQFRKRDRDQKAGGDGIPSIARPRVLTNKGDGALGSALRGLADPINVLDEAGAVVDTLLPGPDRENVWNSERRFGDLYASNLEQNRSILAYDDAEHPWARFGGQLASGVLLPGASVEGVGLAAAREVLAAGGSRFAAEQAARRAVTNRLGVAGAVEGGAAGAGQGEDVRGRVAGVAVGAPVGLALGVGTGVAAPVVAQAIGRPFSRLTGREAERTAGDFTDGAIDTARAGAQNDLTQPPAPSGATADMMMRAELDQPSIVGPVMDEVASPAVDRAASGARPRSMMDPATDLKRLDAAGRLRSSDVLPLPSNTVDGLDEAARIERGRFEDVRAPDERDALDPRMIPSASTGTPIAQRGPLDMVSWLRANGGIRAQGGELEHAGITNAPRKGMDFAGRDPQLGRLISNDGMPYDEAAQRAWEAGFFPDRAEPPTPAEFIDALADTHSGRNRLFRPDDLEEVDRFNATRQERYDVEAARAAGAPLSRDAGQPMGMDDLDANAPPVQAYEEWGENAPNLAGNIRLDKLDSPQAIKRVLTQTEKVTGGFDGARRGRITQAETENLAADLGMTADDLLKRRKGQSFNAEEALASRQVLARSATDLVNMAKRLSRLENPGDEAEAAFREAWLRHAAIQEQVSGMTAEAGRALQQFRQTADARNVGRVLPTLGDVAGGSTRLKDVADKLLELEAAGTTPGGINRFAMKALRARKRDMVMEYYINALLSGPQTHAVNILSNTMTALAQIPEHAIAAGVGGVRRAGESAVSRITKREVGSADRIMLAEVGARTVGLLQGTKDGLRAAARTFRTGEAPDAVTKAETAGFEAIPGRAGDIIRIPTRLLTAEDELFKGIARRMELTGLAVRKARLEGLRGEAAQRRASDLLDNPTDEMVSQSQDYARYLTFQAPLGPMTSKIAGAANSNPILKFLIPFVRTPTNLLKFALERSPAAPILREFRRDIAAGGARRDLAAARALVGTGVAAIFYEAALDGRITGGGPADASAKRLLLADGWQPYSVRVGDRYYSYRRLDPFSTTIGTVADMVDLGSHMTDRQREKSGMLVTAAILNNLSSKTWLSGVSGIAEALAEPDRYWTDFVSRSAGAIAVPSIVAQVARTTDPILREASDPLSRIRSRVPGMSDDLLPRRDLFGRATKSEGGVGPDIVSPIWTGTRTKDPTINALIYTGMRLSPPQRSYTSGGRRVEWSPTQYDRLQQLTGERVKGGLDQLVRAREWQAMSKEDQQDAVTALMKVARRSAKEDVLAGTQH